MGDIEKIVQFFKDEFEFTFFFTRTIHAILNCFRVARTVLMLFDRFFKFSVGRSQRKLIISKKIFEFLMISSIGNLSCNLSEWKHYRTYFSLLSALSGFLFALTFSLGLPSSSCKTF